ncbi:MULTISPECIES: ParM/StbA family protein [unclassified Paenibacillus]|uniref:ParM/StbA family protein n=1 Tax=unclassified Paenibacillus TaxID=185978 RepID=UPI001AE7C2BA|nr:MULTISPECIES: ParM/StbA family protein [unclassified Paenibacillus]MBP1153950.1 plasmid segregation protein ParM [Paenibacillus sp. PvP091]MBP1170665.1 plasmid segregation protein ParM [Paenibacillus sp. PvR098]MBP2441693.1 plasmid segregation protein ParM [Paenibacillus sp. PvP052]
MHNTFLIAVDSGKSTTKGIMREGILQRVKFQTKVEEISNLGAEITPGSFSVEFGNKNYLVGNMLDESKMDFNLSKKTDTHRICIYLAIAQLLMRSKQNIVLSKISLAVNIPISLYKNEKQKTEFSDFIRNNGETINIIVNNKPFLFRIDKIHLFPEGIGPIYSNLNLYRGKRVLIFDVGSLNVNIQEFNNLIPIYDKMLTADLGVNILRSKIADKLSTEYGITVTDEDVEAVYRDKYLILNGEKMEESKQIVDQMLTNHVKEVFNFARSRKVSFSNTEVIFVGGGSLLLKEYISAEYSAAVIPQDPQLANVQSFLTILEAKHHGQS